MMSEKYGAKEKIQRNQQDNKSKKSQSISDNAALTLEEYCLSINRAPFDVWEDIRAGRLEAREFGGEVFILSRPPARGGAAVDREELPSLWQGEKSFLSIKGEQSESPEIALLIDHLSLAKEENREILAFAQKSLEQVRETTAQIVSAKDELLAIKNEKIKLLEEQLMAERDSLIKLKQEKEDLQMLTDELLKS